MPSSKVDLGDSGARGAGMPFLLHNSVLVSCLISVIAILQACLLPGAVACTLPACCAAQSIAIVSVLARSTALACPAVLPFSHSCCSRAVCRGACGRAQNKRTEGQRVEVVRTLTRKSKPWIDHTEDLFALLKVAAHRRGDEAPGRRVAGKEGRRTGEG